MEFRNNFNILSGISTLATTNRNNKTYLSIELLQKKLLMHNVIEMCIFYR